MSEKEPLNIIITGVGGQGNVLLSHLVGKVLVRGGFHATIGETYGASQRGGAVMSHLRVSTKMQYGPLIGEGQADVIVGLEPLETLRVIAQYGNPNVAVMTNSRPVFPQAVSSGGAKYPTMDEVAATLRDLSSRSWVVNATDIALELGPPILANIVMMGTLVGSGLLPLGAEPFEAELRESLPADRLEMNLAAFHRGMAAVATVA
ncbi:MAG TPA: indolepyruvate oxidoreductase subunit beta [Dehalococcoidia bacterium]|nr:indolepyruvate oxidoreductase subunit beta [Dehalococcoidia bacterium]